MLEILLNAFLVISIIVLVGIVSVAIVKIGQAEYWYKMAYADMLTSLKELFDIQTEQIKDIMKEDI